MRRSAKRASSKLSADSQRLVTFAQAIAQASSRLEERGWERALDTLLQKLLKHEHQDTIDAALDHLFKMESMSYDALMESIEAASESCVIEHNGMQYDALLVAAPILAWTRFSIASGPIAPDMLMTLSAHFNAHMLAPDARLAMAPTLYAIDQLPRTYAETYALTQHLGQAALVGNMPRPIANAPETAPFLADTRYLLAAIVVPAGAPLFRWQASVNLTDRTNALAQWRAQAKPNIARILPGCGIELILPEAYYIACREADKQIRPVSIRAGVNFLTHTLNVEPDQLQAVVGKFGDINGGEQIDEYRISFLVDQKPDVLYGIVWPLYGAEDADQELTSATENSIPTSGILNETTSKAPLEEITSILHEVGLIHIKHLGERFPMEFCEDCGAPLFSDAESELTHAEMPEDVPQSAGHFH
ncbi:MAG TPA: DUF2863 family protein [Burkholderiaceae bacterium]